jgi:hypothetical protein
MYERAKVPEMYAGANDYISISGMFICLVHEQFRFPPYQVQYHLAKKSICPRKPRPSKAPRLPNIH